jgi:hypothetical protein
MSGPPGSISCGPDRNLRERTIDEVDHPDFTHNYSDLAVHTPPLADGLTCLDLIRMTLDRYLAGAKGYGQVDLLQPARPAAIIPGVQFPVQTLLRTGNFRISNTTCRSNHDGAVGDKTPPI